MKTRNDYIGDVKKIRTQAEAFLLLGDELTDDELDRMDAVSQKGLEVCEILEAIDSAIEVEQTAQKSGGTPALLNKVARHLSGRDVEVKIEQPSGGVLGACTFTPDDSVKIQISPRAVEDADAYLDVFLHEVAHAKFHAARCDDTDTESEANRQARAWKHYAKKHKRTGADAGGVNVYANDFRLHLFALLDDNAAETLIPTMER